MCQREVLARVAPDAWLLCMSATTLVACFLHFFRLDVVPMGFYVDESSIGYNAYLIANTGADEHGVHWPLFFEAFGEYKNPIYIYLLAAFYKVLGYSEWVTRAASAFCWLMGSYFLYELSTRLFADRLARLYLAISLAFTPWIFTLSRISFDIAAVYPLLSLHLLAMYRGFEERSWKWTFAAGAAISTCAYAYTTFRLLTPLYVLLALVCYSSGRYRRLQIIFLLGTATCAIPYASYAARYPDRLTARFGTITFLWDSTLSVFEKMQIFVANYMSYFSPSFLAFNGDLNPRHHTGFGGELLLSTILLLCVALITLREPWRSPFTRYLIAGLILAPVAACLTVDAHHSLRAFPMFVFAVILSAYAFRALTPVLARSAVSFTAICAVSYTFHYFAVYPAESAVAFENYGFKQALHAALSQVRERGRVILSQEGNVPYINLCFFGTLSGTHVPLLVGTRKDARPGDVYIYYDPSGKERGLYGIDADPARGMSLN